MTNGDHGLLYGELFWLMVGFFIGHPALCWLIGKVRDWRNQGRS